ncbi:MAG TPA: thermonuclease family protein [Cyclobacteriaceae bacterium]|jgi:endonuclease YncB( thermonuclease family)|nr:thermonuclease family protein [Cyclobacteriaceae bacterium]
MSNIISIIFLECSFFFISSPQEILKGKVVNVTDGNTIELLTEANETYKIELAGVDCPETEQPFGSEAKRLLEKSLKGKMVEVFVERKNRWGIRQAVVLAKSGDDPRLKLLAEGLAWTSEKNAIPEFESIRIDAKDHRKGLWINEDPTPPWVFRRQQTMLTPKSSW